MPLISKTSLASELGVTKGRVSQYVAAGMPVHVSGQLDRIEALRFVRDNSSPPRNGQPGASDRARELLLKVEKPSPHSRAETERRVAEKEGRPPDPAKLATKTSTPAKRAAPSTNGTAPAGFSLGQERARLLQAQQHHYTIKNKMLEGRLIPFDRAQAEVQSMFAEVRTRVLGMAYKIADMVVGLPRDQIREVMHREAVEILSALYALRGPADLEDIDAIEAEVDAELDGHDDEDDTET